MELIVRHREREEKLHLERIDSGYLITIGELTYEVDVARHSDTIHSLLIDGEQQEVSVRRQKEGLYQVTSTVGASEVEIMDPLTYLARKAHGEAAAGALQVTAYMPGRVVEIMVGEGDEVEAGQGIVVLEAMKMKNEIQTESAGVVKKLFVECDQAVEGGDPLFEIG